MSEEEHDQDRQSQGGQDQSKQEFGKAAHNRIDFVEFPAPDREALRQAQEFYTRTFGWRYQKWGEDYIDTADSGVGAPRRRLRRRPGTHAGGSRAKRRRHCAGHLQFPRGQEIPFQRPRGKRAGGLVGVALTGTSADGHARVSLGRCEKARHRPARRPRSGLARRHRFGLAQKCGLGWLKGAVWADPRVRRRRFWVPGWRERTANHTGGASLPFGSEGQRPFRSGGPRPFGSNGRRPQFGRTADVRVGKAARLVRESCTGGRMKLVRMA